MNLGYLILEGELFPLPLSSTKTPCLNDFTFMSSMETCLFGIMNYGRILSGCLLKGLFKLQMGKSSFTILILFDPCWFSVQTKDLTCNCENIWHEESNSWCFHAMVRRGGFPWLRSHCILQCSQIHHHRWAGSPLPSLGKYLWGQVMVYSVSYVYFVCNWKRGAQSTKHNDSS